MDKEIQEQVKKYRKDIKDRMDELKDLMSDSVETVMEDMAGLLPYMNTLVYLVKKFSRMYQSEKNSKSLVDYNDLEHLALEVLVEKKMAGWFRRMRQMSIVQYLKKFCVMSTRTATYSRKRF